VISATLSGSLPIHPIQVVNELRSAACAEDLRFLRGVIANGNQSLSIHM
jgi:hypothetical protein